jgi:CTP-dependent riboflavin kinase
MYKDVLEIIAAENLRQALGLQDGDPVELEVGAEGLT